LEKLNCRPANSGGDDAGGGTAGAAANKRSSRIDDCLAGVEWRWPRSCPERASAVVCPPTRLGCLAAGYLASAPRGALCFSACVRFAAIGVLDDGSVSTCRDVVRELKFRRLSPRRKTRWRPRLHTPGMQRLVGVIRQSLLDNSAGTRRIPLRPYPGAQVVRFAEEFYTIRCTTASPGLLMNGGHAILQGGTEGPQVAAPSVTAGLAGWV